MTGGLRVLIWTERLARRAEEMPARRGCGRESEGRRGRSLDGAPSATEEILGRFEPAIELNFKL